MQVVQVQQKRKGRNMLGVCLKYQQNNYGSKLQALATVRTLEHFGMEYEIIRYNKKTIRFLLKSIPRFLNFVFLNDRYDQIQRSIEYRRHPEVLEKIEIRRAAFHAFDVHFQGHLSEVYPSYEKLKKNCATRYQKLITCSDQLWSPSALGSGFYNLMFVPERIEKISWASSFGVSNIPWYQKKRTKEYLSRIQHISMRENRGAEIVRELTGRTVPVLMDPVFVFDQIEWRDLVPECEAEWENYLFCYFLGDNPEHRNAARRLAEKTGMRIVTLPHLDRYVADDEDFGDYEPSDVGPERFLNILRNARCVCTDSFHGAAFSVIHDKQFLIFDRYSNQSSNSKNSRIESLCENLGLENRRYSVDKDILEQMECPIDYSAVQKRLLKYRTETKEYLKKALG